MPPEGYTTLTLPNSLVERLDEYGHEINSASHAATLRNLLSQAKTGDDADSCQLSPGTIEDIANQTSNQVARDLETMLR